MSNPMIFEGDMVRVVGGPFASFHGVVEEVDDARSGLKVAVTIFGRVAKVDLRFSDVQVI